jgi:hypothetical protein
LLIAQLPLVVVWASTVDDELDVFDDVDDDVVEAELDVDVVAVVDPLSLLPLELDALLAVFVAAALWVAVALSPSRHAMRPPRESMPATLSAAAALRARAARGLRCGRGAVGIGSSMKTNLRIGDERATRVG